MSTFAYTSQHTFLKCPPLEMGHGFAIAGLPWDGAVTHRPGARFGPGAIRLASHMLCDGTHPWFEVDLHGALGDAGDLPLPNTSLEACRAALQPQALSLLQHHHMAWLGGDHSLTLGLLRAYREAHGRPLAVIHFDAHCDTWSDHFGEPSGHGTWVTEAIAQDLVDPRFMVQIGIRSAAARDAREYVRDRGGLVFTARALRGLVSPQQLAPIIDAVRDRLTGEDAPALYLSLDIDCLDPAFAPGTGTPEPGGLSTAQVLSLIEAWSTLPFIGMDCVETAPAYDHAELTSQAAAHLVWTYLCGQRRRLLGAGPSAD